MLRLGAAALVAACTLVWAPAAGADPTPLGTQYGLGTTGATAGQLSGPFSVAVGADGNVHVAEINNHRISTFNAQGAFVRAYGFDVDPGGGTGFEVCTTSCKAGVAGGGAGQLSTPNGVVVDAAGNLHVSESGNNRISVFTAQGAFVRAFGFDVDPGGGAGFEVCTTTCKAGVAGGDAGQLNFPRAVAFDAAGNLHVAERDNHRVSIFTPQNGFVRAFGFDVDPGGGAGSEVCTTTCKAGVVGGGAGQLSSPRGIAVDSAGMIQVGDSNNQRISTFTPQGAFVRAFGFDVDPGGGTGFEVCTVSCKIGVPGDAAGQLSFPNGVAVDPAGNVHVADLNNHRVATFSAQGAFVRAFGFDVDPGGGTGFEVCTTSCKAGAAGNAPGQLTQPAGVATDCRGALYVSEQGNQRVQRFGEPGTPLPPCAVPPGPQPPPRDPQAPERLHARKAEAKHRQGHGQAHGRGPGCRRAGARGQEGQGALEAGRRRRRGEPGGQGGRQGEGEARRPRQGQGQARSDLHAHRRRPEHRDQEREAEAELSAGRRVPPRPVTGLTPTGALD